MREHLRDIKQQAMYAVIHGGSSPSLRAQSVKYLSSLPFDGYAIGGSLGKDREELYKILSFTMPNFPENDEKPIHLLGIADDKSLERASSYGLDTFDSCFPTRVARHGTIMTFQKGEENIQIRKTKFKNDLKPLEQDCPCDTCKNHSRAYLHHLYKANEPVVSQLLTVHNMTYMNRLMKRIRERILLNEI